MSEVQKNKSIRRVQWISRSELDFTVDSSISTNIPLYNGLIKHELITSDTRDGSNLYDTLTYSLQLKNPTSNYQPSGEQIDGLCQIISAIIKEKLCITVSTVDITKYEKYILFTPMTLDVNLDPTGIFIKPELIIPIDCPSLLGYQVLSTSKLTRYVVTTNNLQVDSNVVKYVEDVALIPVGITTIEQDKYMEYKKDVDTLIRNLILKGYFTYDFDMYSVNTSCRIMELCKMWGIQVVSSSFSDMTRMILQTTTDFDGITPEQWLRLSLSKIMSGSIPTYTFDGHWLPVDHDEYNYSYGNPSASYLATYGAMRAHAILSKNNEVLKQFTSEIKVVGDLTLVVPLTSLKESEGFYRIYIDIMQSSRAWMIEYVPDLINGVVKRWIIQQADPNLTSLLIPDRDTFVLVADTNIDQSISLKGLQDNTTSLEEAMKDYYSDCHDMLDPISREEVENMSLLDLLQGVKVEEKNIKFCFLRGSLQDLKTPINPMTNLPLSDDVLAKIALGDQGLYGLFKVGILSGLYPEVPTRIYLDTVLPYELQMVPIKLDEAEKAHLGSLYSVDVYNPKNKNRQTLFELAVTKENVPATYKIIKQLWDCGYFFSPWTNAYILGNDGGYNEICLTQTDPELLNGAASIASSNKIINKLNAMNRVVCS